MCVLVIGWRVRDDAPVVLAANRDEAYDRESAPPETIAAGAGWALAPRDRRAGGTWIGLSSSGLVVAITNRRGGDFDPARPSRGELCRAALAAGVHALSNDHALGELELDAARELPWRTATLEALGPELAAFLARHEPEPPSGLVVCKHGGRHGTVSSSVVVLSEGGGSLAHAPGPPCRTAFVQHVLPEGDDLA
jgi:hypothetical protein